MGLACGGGAFTGKTRRDGNVVLNREFGEVGEGFFLFFSLFTFHLLPYPPGMAPPPRDGAGGGLHLDIRVSRKGFQAGKPFTASRKNGNAVLILGCCIQADFALYFAERTG